jgi:hypothetical protein
VIETRVNEYARAPDGGWPSVDAVFDLWIELRESDWQQVWELLRDLANAPAVSADDLIPLRARARALISNE